MLRPPGITFKIFAIAASTLVLLLAIAINTHGKIKLINTEVKALAESILPLSEQIDQAIVATLKQEIHLEKVLRYAEGMPEIHGNNQNTFIQQHIVDFMHWADTAQQYYSQVQNALSDPKADLASLPKDIKRAVSLLYEHNLKFQSNAKILIESIQNKADKHHSEAGLTALLQLKSNEKELNQESEVILEMLQNFAISNALQASRHQQQILLQNALLTMVAVAVGLLYSWYLVKRLSGPIEQLNQQVKNTLLRKTISTIPVKSRDEVGVLTRQFNSVLAHIKHSEQLKDMFGQYLDPGLISHIEKGEQNFKLDGEKQSVTVLLTYIDNLDWQSPELSHLFNDNPDKMLRAINEYLRLQTAEVGQFQGIVNFTDTDILVFWSHPFAESQTHVSNAAEILLKQIQGLDKFKAYLKVNLPQLKAPERIYLRAGLASGELVVANMGPAGAKAFTVIGDEVNAASRKAGIARFFGIEAVLSQQVARQLGDNFTCRPLGKLMVPGKQEIIHAAQLMGKTSDLSTDQVSAIASFISGIKAFDSQDFSLAAAEFQKTLQIYKNDVVSLKYLDQCAKLTDSPPGKDWQHIWQVNLK